MSLLRMVARYVARRWLGYLGALVAVATVSLFVGQVFGQVQSANLAMLYLIAVLATAAVAGRGPAVLASLTAFLTFNWFFVDPRHTFVVADPDEWIALLLFLLTAVVTGQLAAALRQRAAEAEARRLDAEQHEREAIVLYDVVRLLSEEDLASALTAVAERVRSELDVAAVGIHLASTGAAAFSAIAGDDPEARSLLTSQPDAPTQLLGTGTRPGSEQRGAPGPWVRIVRTAGPQAPRNGRRDRLLVVPVSVQGLRVGTLALVKQPGTPTFGAADSRLLSAVAAQLGAALERHRLQREATEAEVLRRTDEQKSALLAAVSHDLRTPLASILAAAGTLRQQGLEWTDEERNALTHDIEIEAQRLSRLVENLLDVSRIEAGSLRPQKAWHDVGMLVEGVLQRLAPMVGPRPVTTEIPDDLPPVLLDPVEIDQVLTNLVENAVKYTPPGTEIGVSLRVAADTLVVAVEDRGPGLSPEALEHAFDPFFRGDDAGFRPRGTGLGLAVARGLVEAHNGTISAENRPGGGARFIVTLPIGAAPIPSVEHAAV